MVLMCWKLWKRGGGGSDREKREADGMLEKLEDGQRAVAVGIVSGKTLQARIAARWSRRWWKRVGGGGQAESDARLSVVGGCNRTVAAELDEDVGEKSSTRRKAWCKVIEGTNVRSRANAGASADVE